LETARTGGADVGEFARRVDDVQPIRPTGVRFPDAVVESVHQHRQRDLEVFHEVLGDAFPLGECLRVGDEDFITDVLRYLSAVGGMRLADVDEVEVGVVRVVLKEFLDLTDRVAERRSGATAEHEDDGLALQIRQFHRILAVGVGQCERRCRIADVQLPPVPLRLLGGRGWRD